MIGTRQSRLEARKKNFKKSVDVEESRKKREDHTVEIRKSKREENLMKKRREKAQPTVVGSGEAANQALDAAFMARIPKLVQDIWSNDTATQLECTKEFRQLLSIGKELLPKRETWKRQ